jgi:multidrug efflux pump subunit AcrA (membrane-fusion protein)
MMDDRETVRFQVQQLHATPGQHVEVGTSLAVLANYQELFIEGSAFERDAPQISLAAKNDWPVTALLDTPSTERERLKDLRILYLSGKVDQDTRTLHFYVTLPNAIEQESTLEGSRQFFSWRFRPGQRMQLLIPVESLPDRIVLPIDAVAFDGPEAYLFTPNGNHFDRRPVHVEYRDSLWAVVANDGSVFPGDQVALSGAQQLQLAIESKSGGPIDPHAGHNH